MNEYIIKEDNRTSISIPRAKEKENKNVKKIYNSETYIGEVLVYIGEQEDGYHKYIVNNEKTNNR